MTPLIFTANRLGDGAVVYLMADGGWSELIGECRIARSEAEHADMAHRAEQAELGQQVVGAYAAEIEIDGAELHPIKLREVIRAAGPTAQSDTATRAG